MVLHCSTVGGSVYRTRMLIRRWWDRILAVALRFTGGEMLRPVYCSMFSARSKIPGLWKFPEPSSTESLNHTVVFGLKTPEVGQSIHTFMTT